MRDTNLNIIENLDFLKFVGEQQSQSVERFTDYIDEAKHALRNPVEVTGEPMPWNKTKSMFGFRKGELTVWAGVNGNGKSLVLSQVAINLAKTSKVLIASMEMHPRQQLKRMLRQATGYKDPSDEQIDKFANDVKDNLWVYNKNGSVPSEQILGMCHWASQELGVNHIIIDSISKCGVTTSANDPQAMFVNALVEIAQMYDVHIHLVNHIRKPDAGNVFKMPTKFDIKGAGQIADFADNILIVHRDQQMIDDREKGKDIDTRKPSSFIRVAKQRYPADDDNETALFNFWWHGDSLQWLEDYPMYGQSIKW